MGRFRIAVSVFCAYTLVVASVLGAVSSASVAGTSHLQHCISSAADGKPLPPVHSSKDGLCCFVATCGTLAGLLSATPEIHSPAEFTRVVQSLASTSAFEVYHWNEIRPRAPPART